MRIALISFEYASGGGIGTYVRNASNMLLAKGHCVESFVGVEKEDNASDVGSFFNVPCDGRHDFPKAVVPIFAARHAANPFDVVEAPEYGAEGAQIAEAFPDLPVVVRLHTPSFVIMECWNRFLGPLQRARFILGAIRRGQWPERQWARSDSSGEREATLAADVVVGPSRAILDLVGERWAIAQEARMLVPNVFIPPKALLDLDPSRHRKTVLFVGRLEVRKGVLDLADAVGLVCSIDPQVRFVFLGRSLPLPHKSHDTKTEMQARIGRWESNVQFIDSVPYAEISRYFDYADVAIFPSIWESFGYVCLEAMAAGCAVIGSSAGGMAEIIEDGRTGLLVEPGDPKDIAAKIIRLMQNPTRREVMARAARQHVLEAYSAESICSLQENSYRRAIERARQRTELSTA